jgi:hypothetical protein
LSTETKTVITYYTACNRNTRKYLNTYVGTEYSGINGIICLFFLNVRIRDKWHDNLDNKLWTRHCLGFIIEIIKATVKKRGTLAFYTLHTLLYDKRGSFYRRLGRSVNFEFFNSQVQPVQTVFKCLGSLWLKIFPPILSIYTCMKSTFNR